MKADIDKIGELINLKRYYDESEEDFRLRIFDEHRKTGRLLDRDIPMSVLIKEKYPDIKFLFLEDIESRALSCYFSKGDYDYIKSIIDHRTFLGWNNKITISPEILEQKESELT